MQSPKDFDDQEQTAKSCGSKVEHNLKLVEEGYKMILDVQSKADCFKNKRDSMRSKKK